MQKIQLKESFPHGIVSEVISPDNFSIIRCEMLTSDHGKIFFDRLEELAKFIPNLPPFHQLGQIQNLVAVIKKNNEMDLFINETIVAVKCLSKGKSKEVGDTVSHDDIADITDVELRGPIINDDDAVFILITHGWRKLLFWDFSQLSGDAEKRKYNLGKVLAQGFARIAYSQLSFMNEDVVSKLFRIRWFPFVTLSYELRKEILNADPVSFKEDFFVLKISVELDAKLDEILLKWESYEQFSNHMEFFKRGIDSYKNNDFISCISLVFPRIEGVLRSLDNVTSWERGDQNIIGKIVPESLKDPATFSALTPSVFCAFVRNVMFHEFKGQEWIKQKSGAVFGRHSIAHGILPSEDYSKGNAARLLLTIDHLCHILKLPK